MRSSHQFTLPFPAHRSVFAFQQNRSEDIWQEEIPYILTSGTLSVGGDFSHFKQNNGIILAEKCRIFETSKPSPFDYPNYALWYLTQDMPLPSDKDRGYFQAVVNGLPE